MKIVVSSTGDAIESQVDMRFGRCLFFLMIDAESNEIKNVEAVQNQGSVQGHGAGIVAAQQVANLKPDKIITGNLGPNAARVLEETGSEVYRGFGTVKDSVRMLLDGKLNKLDSFVPGHHGMVHGKRGRGGGGRGWQR